MPKFFENFKAQARVEKNYADATEKVSQKVWLEMQKGVGNSPDQDRLEELEADMESLAENKDKSQVKIMAEARRELYKEKIAAIIAEVGKKFDEKNSFFPEANRVEEMALGKVLAAVGTGEIDKNKYPDLDLLEDIFIELLGTHLVRDCQRSKENFYANLGDKVRELKKQGIILDDKKVNAVIPVWLQALEVSQKTKAEEED